jgi:hypothetical protein
LESIPGWVRQVVVTSEFVAVGEVAHADHVERLFLFDCSLLSLKDWKP